MLFSRAKQVAIFAMFPLKIVSEGVEAEKQLAFLHENHCDYIQGYYFSKPLPKEEFVSFVKKQGREV